ncbi:MAG: glycerol-3-phosphate 1-O-acyltransferase PlsY [Burkholderiaceae bacterium]|nr:glycerol-3-phosphate 1-O-acyltransferase PlsY [Burkholderiaceae bacterium]MEB2319162.1 glycerol-3-phosphate 1-O-acyltransferase PlsY [Pseudomonadota bacterium]
MATLVPWLAVLVAYLIGSVSFAVVVSRAMGLADPRSYGSGNPGATNVLRTGNRRAAILTLLGDAAKGWVAVFAARMLAAPLGLGEWAIAGVALAVFIGHLYPVFFRFQGGKGVATAAGVLLAISPVLGLATLAVWLAVAAAFRYSSLAALLAAIFAPLCHAFLFGAGPISVAILAMSVLLIWRHRGNIGKLIAGTESRIGAGKDGAGARR